MGQVMTVDPPNGARALISLPSYYIISGIFFSELYKKGRKNTLILIAIFTLSFFFSILDIYTYKLWMGWIKV